MGRLFQVFLLHPVNAGENGPEKANSKMKLSSTLGFWTLVPLLLIGCVSELGGRTGDDEPSASGGGGALGESSSGGTTSASGGLGSGGGGTSDGLSGGTGGGPLVDGGSVGSGGESGGGLTVDDYYGFLCEECHGPSGDGVEGHGPDIKHPVRDYAEWVIRNGRGVADDAYGVFSQYYEEDMVAHGQMMLPDDVMVQIFDFLDQQPQPTTGQGLYEDYCAACHGPDAQGGLTDRPITMETDEVMDNVRDGAHLGEFDNRHEYMPALTESELSDAELQLIIDYILSL